MALFKISKGLAENLPSTKTAGYCWYTFDDSKFYIDYEDENGRLQRKALNSQDAETLCGASLATILSNTDLEIPTSSAVLSAIEAIEKDYLTSTDKGELQDNIDEVSEKVADNTDAIATLTGSGAGSIEQSIEDAFNKFASDVTNDGTVNTYIELVKYAAEHSEDFVELVGVVDAIGDDVDAVAKDLSNYKTEVAAQFDGVNTNISVHTDNTENPHNVTKDQLGLGDVDNTADMDKPVSTLMQEALDLKSDEGHHHDDLYYDKDETLGLITVEDIDNICALIQGGGESVDPVTAATKYWVERYFQPKGDYLTETDINTHNSSSSAHSDIRLRIEEIADDFYAFADCDDETLSQLQEVVNYIKNNTSLIEGVTTSKVNVSDIVNNLTTNVKEKPLSAAQGVALKALIDAIVMPTKVSQLENDSGYLVSYIETDPTVPAWAKAPSKPTYTASEVGAATAEHGHIVTVTGTNASSTVTGTVTVPTVSKTQKYMTVSADAPVVTPTTDSVLGSNTKFTVSGGAVSTTKLAATASGVTVGAKGTANAITGFGEHTTAAVITELNTTTIKSPTVTPVSIPNVTKNDSVTASKVSATAGTAASWNASVSNGVLSFDWVSNIPTEVSATDVNASKVTLGTALSASSVSTTNVTVATGSKSTADAITALGAPTTASALTGVKVTAQPKVTLATSSAGDVTVVTGVGAISVSAGGDNVNALTGVGVAAPAITLDNTESNVPGSVPVISAVEIGYESTNLQNGVAAAQKWTQSTGTTGALQ